MRGVLARLLALVLLAGAAGCGGGGGGGGGDAREPEPTTPAEPAITVEVGVYLPSLGGGARRFELSCDPPRGTHPNAEEACAALEAHPDALEPVPKDVLCTQEYGGRQRADVHGRVNGEEVVARFNRSNGCEIARWDKLAPVLNVGE